MHLSLILDMAADALGDRPAVTAPDGTITYAELRERADALAGSLAGERAVQLGLNSLAVPVTLFAAARAGAAFTPLNYRLADQDLVRIATRAAPAAAVVDHDMVARVASVEGLAVIETEALRDVAAADFVPDFDTDNTAILLFTSGTTGEPKAAVLRHRHVTSYVMGTLEFASAGEEEAALVTVPPYHIAGISAVVSSTYVGRRIVYLAAFDPQSWVDTAASESITHAMVVPTMLGRILDVMEAGQVELPALRHLSYGGGKMPVPVIERALQLMPHVNFVNAYGLTETSSTIAVLTPEDHRAAIASDDPDVRRRLGSVGRPSAAIELTIRDPFGEELPPGEHGEIWVRGEQVSGEYVGRSGAGEWFATRDGGYLDAEGFLFIEGRLDDVIVRGGENISPGEIEEVLREHPAVDDVAVYAIPSQEWGEDIGASIVLVGEVEPDELREWVRARLRSTRVPALIDIRTELPYNETGKLLRRVLKAENANAVSTTER
jgi:acyl-CoA synthetase (AMP-forming)/AMP-acid ligase II